MPERDPYLDDDHMADGVRKDEFELFKNLRVPPNLHLFQKKF